MPNERNLQTTVLNRLKKLHQADPSFAYRKKLGSTLGRRPRPLRRLGGVPFQIELKKPGENPTPAPARAPGRVSRSRRRDVEELIMEIGAYIDQHNQQPKPFIWTARAADILEKVKCARRKLDNPQSA